MFLHLIVFAILSLLTIFFVATTTERLDSIPEILGTYLFSATFLLFPYVMVSKDLDWIQIPINKFIALTLSVLSIIPLAYIWKLSRDSFLSYPRRHRRKRRY